MITSATNSTNIHKYEQDLVRKRQDEFKHAKDIRLIYERKLERTNNLYAELSACFLQLEEREKEISEREKQMGSAKPYRKIVTTLQKKHFDKISRRRICNTAAFVHQASPVSTPSSPVKATLYAQLDGQHPVKAVVQSSGGSQRSKKLRHKRNASGSLLMTPKASPNRDSRRIQSEPQAPVRLVDSETQTEAMDITPDFNVDAGPTSTHRQMTLCLRTDENNKQQVTYLQKSSPIEIANDQQSCSDSDVDSNVPGRGDTTSSNTGMANSMLTSSALTGMSSSLMSASYDLNSENNNEIIRECSDDDHLETLGRKGKCNTFNRFVYL